MTAPEFDKNGADLNHDQSDETARDIDQSGETESFLPVPAIQLVEEGSKHDDTKDTVKVNYRDYSLCKRLGVDLPFRRRFIHTIWLFWAFVGLGWCVGQNGPSYPDLRLIVQKDLETSSWLFTVGSIGYLLGSLVGGAIFLKSLEQLQKNNKHGSRVIGVSTIEFASTLQFCRYSVRPFSVSVLYYSGILYDHFNKLLLMFISVLIIAIGSGVTPWCTPFPLMLAVRFVCGLGFGGLDTGGNADLVSIWDEEGRPYMQALHFCFGFGGILSPLATEPFLAPKECVPYNISADLGHNSSSATAASLVTMATKVQNMTTNNTACQEVFGETRIHYAFLITAILVLSMGLPFLIMYINTLRSKTPHEMVADKQNMKRPDKLPLRLKVILLIFLGCFMGMYCAVEDTFASFLMTFSINYLEWDKSVGSFATSLYWAAFSLGRFSGIFLIRFFRPVALLRVYLLSLILAFTGLLIASYTHTIHLVWVFIPLAGFSMSIVFPCIFTWTEECILEVTGMISSMFLIAASFGLMINPLFLGYVMENYSPLWFVYLELGESIVCFSLFVTIFIIVKKYVQPIQMKQLEMEIVVPDLEDTKT